MKRIYHFVIRRLASFIIWYLHRGGFVIVSPNDAAIIFREDSETPEVRFPWHLTPDIPEGEEDVEMPQYLAAAMVLIFAQNKNWLMRFINYYLNNEAEVDGDLDTYKQQMIAAVHAEHTVQAAGQPEESKETLH